ncbi:hypothetical protein KTI61_13700 [Acinetobacter pittii]|uniref:O-antigen polymerase n=1 Tax=Acinetobacter pittii TaxID=48296 RepID=UPI0021CD5550|nr:O-antigen polymerase [Acinetobacter pittii]MCU4550035.1 hypothetical protein [Acinetobacter pittii]
MWNKYSPLKIFICYIFFTLLLFYCGPWPWPGRHNYYLPVFMFFVLTFFSLGYFFGVNQKVSTVQVSVYKISKLYNRSLSIALVLFVPTLYWRTNGEINLAQLSDFGEIYRNSHALEDIYVGKTAWIEYLRIIFSYYLMFPIILMVIFWNKLTIRQKRFGFLFVLSEISLALFTGTNKIIGTMLVIIIFSILIKLKGKFLSKKIFGYIFISIALLWGFISYFTKTQVDRADGETSQRAISSIQLVAENDNILLSYLPSSLIETYYSLSAYMSQGYQGLAYAFDIDYNWTYGVGYSRFLTVYFDKYLDLNVSGNTIPALIQNKYGWDENVNWHTMYVWFASDMSFYGVYFLMLFVGFLLGKTWKESVLLLNPISILLFIQLAILMTYSCANNQIFQSGTGTVCFFVTLFIWFFHKNLYGEKK